MTQMDAVVLKVSEFQPRGEGVGPIRTALVFDGEDAVRLRVLDDAAWGVLSKAPALAEAKLTLRVTPRQFDAPNGSTRKGFGLGIMEARLAGAPR